LTNDGAKSESGDLPLKSSSGETVSHHGKREAKALAFIRRRGRASTLEIGCAAVAGETRARFMPPKAKDGIGLSIAVSLTKRGLIEATHENEFRMVRPTSIGRALTAP
jgi:hypothetical protein